MLYNDKNISYDMKELFKWYHYEKEVIILAVHWYCKYTLSYRNLEEILSERGLKVYESTIYRWVVEFAPIIIERSKKYLRKTNSSWRMDETYLKIKGKNLYLYRGIDSDGDTIDFLVSEKRDKITAKKFFIKALKNHYVSIPEIITTDKYKPTISGIEIFAMFRKRQVSHIKNVLQEINFIYQLLGVTPSNFSIPSSF